MSDKILNNINALLAKLRPSTYREYVKNWDKERYSDLFNGKYRIYLPNIIDVHQKPVLNITQRDNKDNINEAINSFITVKNITKNPPIIITNNDDYLRGIATDENGREYKIGKLLTEYIKYQENWITENEKFVNDTKPTNEYSHIDEKNLLTNKLYLEKYKKLLTTFNQRPSYDSTQKKLIIVISRHPYDVIGMSTDRNWKSCMLLPGYDEKKPQGGEYYDRLEYDVKEGTLVAYLIEDADKNINNPVARIAIKPFKNVNNNSILLEPETRARYGGEYLTNDTKIEFETIVKNWCNEANKDLDIGVYKKSDELYDDSNGAKTQLYGPHKEETIIKITEFFNSPDKIKNMIKNIFTTDRYSINSYSKLKFGLFMNTFKRQFDDTKYELSNKCYTEPYLSFIYNKLEYKSGEKIESRAFFDIAIKCFRENKIKGTLSADEYSLLYLNANIFKDKLDKSDNLGDLFDDKYNIIPSTNPKHINYKIGVEWPEHIDNPFHSRKTQTYHTIKDVATFYIVHDGDSFKDSVFKYDIAMCISDDLFTELNSNSLSTLNEMIASHAVLVIYKIEVNNERLQIATEPNPGFYVFFKNSIDNTIANILPHQFQLNTDFTSYIFNDTEKTTNKNRI